MPTQKDYDLAREWLGQHETGLKAGDALHLAIAKNHAANAIYSLERRLISSASLLGVPANTGFSMPGYDQ